MDFENLHQILRSLYEDMTPYAVIWLGLQKV